MKIPKIFQFLVKNYQNSLHILLYYTTFVLQNYWYLNIIDMENMAIVAMTSKELAKARVISSRVNDSFLTGYLLAQGVELRKRMREGIVEVWFTKKSGEVAHRYATTSPSLVRNHINGRGTSGESRNVITFWDVEKGDWRSMQIQSILKIR